MTEEPETIDGQVKKCVEEDGCYMIPIDGKYFCPLLQKEDSAKCDYLKERKSEGDIDKIYVCIYKEMKLIEKIKKKEAEES